VIPGCTEKEKKEEEEKKNTFQLFEKHPSGIPASQHHMLGAANGQRNCKNLRTYCGELVNYILDKTEENLLTASSTAREVSARVKLLQATQSIANSWSELSSKTFQNCFAPFSLKHSSLEMPNMANIENEAILEIQRIRNYEEFVRMDNSLQCYNEIKDYEEAILVQIAAKYQEIAEDKQSNEADTPELEQVSSNQYDRKYTAELQ
jgi:hypothetical protein